ncbi:MAG TPA: hypothetical protein VN962_27000 [Polyangia bacterium]|nr:hypothetical protein [Polyangia bacterium]
MGAVGDSGLLSGAGTEGGAWRAPGSDSGGVICEGAVSGALEFPIESTPITRGCSAWRAPGVPSISGGAVRASGGADVAAAGGSEGSATGDEGSTGAAGVGAAAPVVSAPAAGAVCGGIAVVAVAGGSGEVTVAGASGEVAVTGGATGVAVTGRAAAAPRAALAREAADDGANGSTQVTVSAGFPAAAPAPVARTDSSGARSDAGAGCDVGRADSAVRAGARAGSASGAASAGPAEGRAAAGRAGAAACAGRAGAGGGAGLGGCSLASAAACLRARSASGLCASKGGGSVEDRTWSAEGVTSGAGLLVPVRSSARAVVPLRSKPASALPHATHRPNSRPSMAIPPFELMEAPLGLPANLNVGARNSPGEGLQQQMPFPNFWEVVTSPQPKKLAKLIQDLRAARRRSRTAADLYDLARRRIEAPHEILEWAKGDRRWSFTLAEQMTNEAHHPHELATGLVVAMADELEEEREMLADDSETLATGAIEPN